MSVPSPYEHVWPDLWLRSVMVAEGSVVVTILQCAWVIKMMVHLICGEEILHARKNFWLLPGFSVAV